MKNSMVVTKNTLLIGKGLPPFESIKSEDVVPAITELLIELEQELINLEGTDKPTWNDLVEPLQKLEDRLTWSWGIVGHLMGVKNSPELRKAYNEIQPKVVEFINKLSQSQPIYQAFKNLIEIGFSIIDAVQMTSTNAADYIERIDIGKLSSGCNANIVVLDDKFDLLQVFLNGETVYEK